MGYSLDLLHLKETYTPSDSTEWVENYLQAINVYWVAVESSLSKKRRNSNHQTIGAHQTDIDTINRYTQELSEKLICYLKERISSENSSLMSTLSQYFTKLAQINERVAHYTQADIVVKFPNKRKRRKEYERLFYNATRTKRKIT